jgi:hypothetical protein
MTCRLWLYLAVGAIGIATPVAAQQLPATEQGLSIEGTSRVRYEAIGGQVRAGFNERDDLVSVRTTLQAEFKEGPLRLVAELWDSRVYGGGPGTPITAGEANAFELVQAFGEFKSKDLLGSSTSASLRAGRFLLNLGSRRLVAADDYRNAPSGYTGVRADLGFRDAWGATLVYALPHQRRPDDSEGLRRNVVALDREGFDQVLWGGLVSRTRVIGSAMVEASFFHLGERDRPDHPTRDRSLDTAALRVISEPEPGEVDFEAESIVQRGRISTSNVEFAPRQKVRAWFVHAEAGYTFATRWKTRISIEYDHASGDRSGGSYGRFDTLFGMRRTDLGPSGLYSVLGRTNSISPGLRIEATPDARTDVMAMLRPIWLAAARDSFSTTGVRDPSGRSGSFAGVQFDGRVRHKLSKELRLEFDAVLLAKGRFLRAAPNAQPDHWTRYASFNITASF